MKVALRIPQTTRKTFFDWAEAHNERYEFDGFQPVAMVGGTRNHSRITLALHRALHSRLRGTPCEALGPTPAWPPSATPCATRML